MITLSVNNRKLKINCLVDTGSSVTLMREDIYKQVCTDAKRPEWLSTATPLYSVSGGNLKVVGKTDFKFDNCKPQEIFIVKDIIHECILGIDFLSKAKAELLLYKNYVELYGKVYPYQRGHLNSIGAVDADTGSSHINQVLKENDDVFSTEEYKLGECLLEPCEIPTGNAAPIKQRPRRLPLEKRHLVEEQVREMMEAGVIRPSNSPWASPVVLVPKPDGSTRFCIDYRKTNSVTITDAYSLPSIQDIFDSMEGATIFSTMDLTSGYWQIPMHVNSISKTAFCTHMGNFEFIRMPFGLKNAPSVFQRTLNKVLSGLIGKICFVYIDDIVIFSRSEKEHAEHLKLVFQRLRDANFKLKRKKCHFAKEQVKLLGYNVSSKGISPQESKVSAIKNLPQPQDKRDVRSFLGMTNYYRQCIPNYSQISRSLQNLTSIKSKFEWNEQCEESFQALKTALTSERVMAFPKVGQPYRLYTDACDYAVGGVLTQTDEEGIERPIHYISHQLDNSQKKWATIEKEAYAVVYALQKLRPYLWGAKFTIYTDHKPLKSLFLQEVKNTRIQRWAVLIAEFGAPIQYREGRNNIRADMLSRIKMPDTVSTVDTYTPAYAIDEKQERLLFQADEINREQLVAEQKREFPELYKNTEIEDSGYLRNKIGILYSERIPYPTAEKYPRVVLPTKFRMKAIQRSHEECGHLSVEKTMKRTQDLYVWPGMRREIREFIDKCATCRVHQSRTYPAKFGEMPIANYPFEIIGIDLIGPFVKSEQGNKYILTVIDHCTGWAEAYPIPDKRCVTIQRIFSNNLFPQHGYSRIIIQDNGLEFNNRDWLKSLEDHGIEVRKSTVYHPQTNGKCERFNRTLKEMITRLVNNRQSKWEDQVAPALMAYRNSVSSVTGYTPFFLLYGRQGRLPLSTAFNNEWKHHFEDSLYEHDKALNIARGMTELSRKYNRERINAKSREGKMSVGDHVIYKAPEKMTFTARFDPHWVVTRIRGPVVWILHQESGKRKTVNKDKLVVVDPEISWDHINRRPIRKTRPNQRELQRALLQSDENQDIILSEPDQTEQQEQQDVTLPKSIQTDNTNEDMEMTQIPSSHDDQIMTANENRKRYQSGGQEGESLRRSKRIKEAADRYAQKRSSAQTSEDHLRKKYQRVNHVYHRANYMPKYSYYKY